VRLAALLQHGNAFSCALAWRLRNSAPPHALQRHASAEVDMLAQEGMAGAFCFPLRLPLCGRARHYFWPGALPRLPLLAQKWHGMPPHGILCSYLWLRQSLISSLADRGKEGEGGGGQAQAGRAGEGGVEEGALAGLGDWAAVPPGLLVKQGQTKILALLVSQELSCRVCSVGKTARALGIIGRMAA